MKKRVLQYFDIRSINTWFLPEVQVTSLVKRCTADSCKAVLTGKHNIVQLLQEVVGIGSWQPHFDSCMGSKRCQRVQHNNEAKRCSTTVRQCRTMSARGHGCLAELQPEHARIMNVNIGLP